MVSLLNGALGSKAKGTASISEQNCFPSCGSPAPAHHTQLRELKRCLGQTVQICKGLPPSINNPMYQSSSSMGQTLENSHNGQNRACHTEVLRGYFYGPEFSTCPSRIGTLGFTNLPWQPSASEQSHPEGRPDTLGSLTACHWFIISTQRQRKKKYKKKGKPFPCSCKTGCPWVTLPKSDTLPPLSGRDQRLFISNGFRFHGSWSRGAQLHHHPDFTA